MSMTPPAGPPAAPPAAPAPGSETPPAPTAPPTPPGNVPQPPPAAPPAPNEQTPPDPNDTPWADPEKAKLEIERLRRENGDARINAKKTAADEARKELLETLTAALDPEAAKAGQPATVEQLVAQLQTTSTERDTAKAETSTAARELAIVREAWKQGVDPSKLEYLSFTLSRRADFGTKTPDSEDFGATLSAVITEEITKDQSLRASGAHTGTGAPQFGGAAGVGAMSKAEFDGLDYSKRLELYTNNRTEYDRLVNS